MTHILRQSAFRKRLNPDIIIDISVYNVCIVVDHTVYYLSALPIPQARINQRCKTMEKEEKTRLTKEKILKAGISEFGRNGYRGGSINAICASGISKGLIYHNLHRFQRTRQCR